jgi:hypothetical protein
MTLPATLEEAEALAYARHQIARWRDAGNPWSEDSILTPEASRAAVRNIYRNIAMAHCDGAMDIIKLAHARDPDADEVLLQLIREYLSRGEQLPTELAFYNMEVTQRGEGWRFRKRRGQKWHHSMLRNIGIAMLVAAICDRFAGFSPTGSSPHRKSACEIVAEALDEAEFVGARGRKAVEEVWRNYKGVAPTVAGWTARGPVLI